MTNIPSSSHQRGEQKAASEHRAQEIHIKWVSSEDIGVRTGHRQWTDWSPGEEKLPMEGPAGHKGKLAGESGQGRNLLTGTPRLVAGHVGQDPATGKDPGGSWGVCPAPWRLTQNPPEFRQRPGSRQIRTSRRLWWRCGRPAGPYGHLWPPPHLLSTGRSGPAHPATCPRAAEVALPMLRSRPRPARCGRPAVPAGGPPGQVCPVHPPSPLRCAFPEFSARRNHGGFQRPRPERSDPFSVLWVTHPSPGLPSRFALGFQTGSGWGA